MPSQNAYYGIAGLLAGPSAAASQGQQFMFKSSQPIGEAFDTLQPRMALPNIPGESPGCQFSYQACGPGASTQDSFAAIGDSVANRSRWYTPVLETGSTTFSSDYPNLKDDQVQAGDNPTVLRGNSWTWIGINGVTMLATSTSAQDSRQNGLFFAGIYLGVAEGALIAFANELLRSVWRRGRTGTQ